MRKKNNPKMTSIREDCEIKPFMLLEACEEKEEGLLAEKKGKNDSGLVCTPRKKGKKRVHEWLAARKEEPFRDLSN